MMEAESEVERLLAAACDTIREVPFFWVITATREAMRTPASSTLNPAVSTRNSGYAGF